MTTTQTLKDQITAIEQQASQAFDAYLATHNLINPVMVFSSNGVALWRGIKLPAGCEWWVILDSRNGKLTDAGSVGGVALAIWKETVRGA